MSCNNCLRKSNYHSVSRRETVENFLLKYKGMTFVVKEIQYKTGEKYKTEDHDEGLTLLSISSDGKATTYDAYENELVIVNADELKNG